MTDLRSVGSASPVDGPDLHFVCNICGAPNTHPLHAVHREGGLCRSCGSTVRWRAVVHALTTELFGRSTRLDELPTSRHLVGLGLSDWDGYAKPLAEKCTYVNTYFDREPSFDISVGDPSFDGSLDFLLASDVFEHVAPPVSRAFVQARRMLRPGGVLILTVPYGVDGPTLEHFPNLHDYKIVERDGTTVLSNVTESGRNEVFEDLVFHGGEGATLEMRQFSERDLRRELSTAGFSLVRVYDEDVLPYGIKWWGPWSLPMAARSAS